MKNTGFAIKCPECDSNNIKKGESISNAHTNSQTLKCNDCDFMGVVVKSKKQHKWSGWKRYKKESI